MSKRQHGFTIIELLIATAVFSVVLLTLSAAIIQIGRIYSKGVTAARTQEITRNLVSDIADAIQLTPGQITTTGLTNPQDHTTQGLCVDDRRYSFVLGQQRLDDKHALVVDTVNGGCVGAPAQNLTNPPANLAGTELLDGRMRLSNLSINETAPGSGSYRITARVVYGDDDLLCATGFSCTDNSVMSAAQISAARDLRCKDIRAGTQFCSASELSTIVERRMQ